MPKTRTYYLIALLPCICCLFPLLMRAQDKQAVLQADSTAMGAPKKVFYGQASYYANKFHGQQAANGEIFRQDKFTAACNVLPLNTWIRVTNLRNNKSVIVRTTDRLHPKMRRLVDLSRVAAEKLGYISQGLTRVKVEVLDARSVGKR